MSPTGEKSCSLVKDEYIFVNTPSKFREPVLCYGAKVTIEEPCKLLCENK